MPSSVREVLAQRASECLVARAAELGALSACLADSGPIVVHLHGIAGAGKSTLLAMFAAQLRAEGVVALVLDARSIEPTPSGFLTELGVALGQPVASCEQAAALLAREGGRMVLAIDGYELLRLLDTWMRQTFVPALDTGVRVVLASRHPPAPSWLAAPEWQGLFRRVVLGPLSQAEAMQMLARGGCQGEVARQLNRFAKGHPLALRLAAALSAHAPGMPMDENQTLGVVQHLTELYLAEMKDTVSRTVVEAASVLRRVTKSVIGAMLPGPGYADAYDRLAALPFVESSREGLMMHEAVRDSVAAALRAAHPARYGEYRLAAWRQLRAEARSTTRDQHWRYTADMLFLLQNPHVREAFFPSAQPPLAVEPATEVDRGAIFDIVARHESAEAATILDQWWAHAPGTFHVTRDASGHVAGFYILARPSTTDEALVAADPLLRAWQRHLGEAPLERDEMAVYLRRWLSAEHGEAPSMVQAECWLDVKRSYMELRSRLRRCYISVCDLPTYAPKAVRLGFRHLEHCTVEIDGIAHHLAVLDFGPSSVDGWLGTLVAGELGEERESLLNANARELVLEGRRIALTPLEYGVFEHLLRQAARVVSRDELLDRVWGPTYEGGSNVVDVVVRSLRKKLGGEADMIETVRGLGYRLPDARGIAGP